MRLNLKKAKTVGTAIAKFIAIVIGCLIFWWGVTVAMWAFFDAGFVM